MKRIGRILFVFLLTLCVLPHVGAQAPAGYTKVATVSNTTYTDSTGLVAGQVNQYVVTAFNAAGESAPSNVVTAITPSTASTACGTGIAHCNILSWTPGAGGSAPTGYNVYKQLVTPPNSPAGLAVVNN